MNQSREPINIIISPDENYADPYLVMLTSLFESNKEEIIRVWIFYSANKSKGMLKWFNKLSIKYGQTVIFKRVDENLVDTLPKGIWPVETWFRHLAINLLPSDTERALYLDGDMIVVKGIRNFYDQDFGNKYYVCCKDIGIEEDVIIQEKKRCGLSAKNTYYNAGMMLININQIRKKYSFSDFYNFAIEHSDNMIYLDQSLLNSMFKGKIKKVDEKKYNCQINAYSPKQGKKLLKNAVIIHYSGEKPWNKKYKLVAGCFWWRYKIIYDKRNIVPFCKWAIRQIIFTIPEELKDRILHKFRLQKNNLSP